VTKLTQLHGGTAAVLIAAVLVAILVAPGRAAGAETASASFCNDSAQLQSWIAQDEQPGIDQYGYPGYPELAVIRPEADYLEKLSAEAPQAIQPAFSVWANFAKAVEEATATAIAEKAAAPPGLSSFPALASQINPATAAATQVQHWLKNDSGCRQLYVAEHDPSNGGHGINPLWFVGGGFLILIILGAIFGSSGEGRSVPNYSSSGSNDSSSTKRSWTYEGPDTPTPKAKCSYPGCGGLWGPGKVQCPGCGGRRQEEGYDSNGNHQIVRCIQCGANGWITCPGCGGSGEAR